MVEEFIQSSTLVLLLACTWVVPRRHHDMNTVHVKSLKWYVTVIRSYRSAKISRRMNSNTFPSSKGSRPLCVKRLCEVPTQRCAPYVRQATPVEKITTAEVCDTLKDNFSWGVFLPEMTDLIPCDSFSCCDQEGLLKMRIYTNIFEILERNQTAS